MKAVKVARVKIENYRNLRSVDVPLDNLVALVGENNSGKSNFLRAIALPFSSDDGGSRSLTWHDINNDAKACYYKFIEENRGAIADGTLNIETLCEYIPSVTVTVDLEGDETEGYDLKDLLTMDESGEFVARIRYKWRIGEPQKLLSLLRELLGTGVDIQKVRMSLLPMNLYRYEIVVPDDGKVSYDVFSRFRHVTLPAERDNFAASTDRLGSRALIGLFQEKLSPNALKGIEQEYGHFVDVVRDSAKLDKILNWQDYTDAPNAKEFFDEISVLPNMPAMSSILGGIRLGYGDESLAFQGLGHRNLILMAVILNAYLNDVHDISLRVMSVEEPEAHLCVNNVLLMASLFTMFGSHDSRTQIVYSTHDTEFVNKVGLDKVIVFHDGTAHGLKDAFGTESLGYLANNPNTDIFKLLFSHRLVLVEGITEELLIKSYLQTKHELSDIKVMSFHKGYKDIIKIWKTINGSNGNRLGIVRDYDNQPKAQADHEALQDDQICIKTTSGYTLETDIVATGTNHRLLVDKYGDRFGWDEMSENELQEDWRSNKKTEVMLAICHDLVAGELGDFKMPRHIQDVLEFLSRPVVPTSDDSIAPL